MRVEAHFDSLSRMVPGSLKFVFRDQVAWVHCSGDIDGALVERALVELRAEARSHKIDAVFLDAGGVTDVNADVRYGGAEVIGLLKSSGAKKMFSYSASGPFRMLCVSVAFAVGLHTKFFETKEMASDALLKRNEGVKART
jgi:hypothetical protein